MSSRLTQLLCPDGENELLSWESVRHLGHSYSRAQGGRLVIATMAHTDNTFIPRGPGCLPVVLWPEEAKFRDGQGRLCLEMHSLEMCLD